MNKLILLTLLFWAVLVMPVVAEDDLPRPASLPIEVTAEQLEADRGARTATFSGQVAARQGDVTLYCDKLIAYSLPDQDEVDRLEAFGSVRVIQLDRTATADRAIYRQTEGTLVLYGNAEVHQGQNRVAGAEIVVYLNEDRSVVKSGESGRVKAVLFPESTQEQQ